MGRRLLQAIALTRPEYRAPLGGASQPIGCKVMIQPQQDVVGKEGQLVIRGAIMIPQGSRMVKIPTGPEFDQEDTILVALKGREKQFKKWTSGKTGNAALRNINSAEVSSLHAGQGFRDSQNAKTGGSVALITWQPSLAAFGPQGAFIPAFVGLAHELIHAHHYLTGSAYNDRQTEENVTVGCGVVFGNKLDPFDAKTLPEFCENQFRLALQLKPTTEYKI